MTSELTRGTSTPSQAVTHRVGRKDVALWRHTRQVVSYVVAFVVLLPLIWLVISAFRPAADIFTFGIPKAFTIDNFIEVMRDDSFGRYMLNSAFIAVVSTAFALWFHSMAGFALARLKFPGRETIFISIIATLLISFSVILVPLFLLVKQMGLLNTYTGVILPSTFTMGGFAIFWLRQAYLGIPTELEDACRVDGCGWLRVWWHIGVPLSRPVLAALAVLLFVGTWNAYLWPLAILSDTHKWTVQLGLANLQGQFAGAWNAIMAGSVVIAIPTVVFFAIFQKQIIDSLKSSGLK